MKRCFFLLLFVGKLLGEDLLLKGDKSFNDAKFEEAIKYYNEYLMSIPLSEDASDVYYKIGEALFKLEKFSDASEKFKNIISLYPQSQLIKSSLLRLGDCYVKLNKKEKAIATYERLKSEYPETEEAKEAISRLNDLLPKKPTRDEIERIKEAKALFEKGSYTAAYNKFLSFINDYPHSTYTSYARFKIGESLYYQGKYDDAIKAYKDFLKNPDSRYAPYVEYSLSFAYFKTGNYKEGSKTIGHFLEKHKDSKYYEAGLRLSSEISRVLKEKEADLLFNDAKAYFKKKQLETSKAKLDELIKTYPDYKYKNEAKALLSEINEVLAEKSTLRIKELYDKGIEQLSKKQYKGAIEVFERIIRDFPETEYTNLSREALLKANKGKLEDDAYIKYNEGLNCLEGGKEDEARALFQAVISDFPTTDYCKKAQERLNELALKDEEKEASSLYKEGISLLRDGNYSSSLEHFEKLIALYPSSIYASLSKEKVNQIKGIKSSESQKRQYEIAMKYYELGEYNEAYNILNNIVSIWKDTEYAKKAKNVISKISDKLTEEDASTLFKMAQSYYENNDYDKAFSLFKKIVELYPQSRYANASILAMGKLNEKIANDLAKKIYDSGASLLFQKKYEQAIEAFDNVLSSYPTSYWVPHSQYLKGEAMFLKKDYEGAILAWQGIITQFKESSLAPDALYHIAESYRLLNMKSDAASAYKRLLLEYPESIYARGQLRVLITERIKELER